MTPADPAAVTRAAILHPDFRRATFAGAARLAPSRWVRVAVRPVAVRGAVVLQFAHFDGKTTDVRNVPPADAGAAVDELLAAGFAGVHVETAAGTLDLRTTRRGKRQLGRSPARGAGAADLAHNRVKPAPLPEDRARRLWEVLGVAAAGGAVKPTMRAKFTQVNEFVKHLGVALDAAGLGAPGGPLAVLDCGCGASYLTLAAWHYLTAERGLAVTVTGVDANPELVAAGTARAAELGAAGVTFAVGKIADLTGPADVVLALHACDTATDDALGVAVRAGAKVILSVPCCHHALNARLAPTGPAAGLAAVFRHGILRERLADGVTDALRAAALRVAGYRADVVEFVGPDHTAKNLLIRAVKTGVPGDPAAAAEYAALKAFWGVVPAVEAACLRPGGAAGGA